MFEQIINKIDRGMYDTTKPFPRKNETMKDGYITDENKSVKWNKEQVELNKENYKKLVDEYHLDANEKFNQFWNDTLNAIMNSDKKFSKHNAEVILNRAWDKEHSYGSKSVIDEVMDLIDFLSNIE